jgi:hypothetical protein
VLAELQNPMGVSWIVRGQRENGKPFLASLGLRLASFRTNNELRVAALPKPSGEQKQLPLAAAQFLAGVEMDDLEFPGSGHRGL